MMFTVTSVDFYCFNQHHIRGGYLLKEFFDVDSVASFFLKDLINSDYVYVAVVLNGEYRLNVFRSHYEFSYLRFLSNFQFDEPYEVHVILDENNCLKFASV